LIDIVIKIISENQFEYNIKIRKLDERKS